MINGAGPRRACRPSRDAAYFGKYLPTLERSELSRNKAELEEWRLLECYALWLF
jgi:hypothetical protein